METSGRKLFRSKKVGSLMFNANSTIPLAQRQLCVVLELYSFCLLLLLELTNSLTTI